MKNIFLFITIVGLSIVITVSFAQDCRTLNTKVADILTQMPTKDLVHGDVRMDTRWDHSISIFESDTIELRTHGNDLTFRDIYVLEINTNHIGLTDEEIVDGFVSLFNGKNLDGWQGNTLEYSARNGELILLPVEGRRGNLYTVNEYSNFIIRFEFLLSPGANNGLGIRAPLIGDAAYLGMELQILDNTAPVYAKLEDYQYHGSIYGVIPAKRGFLKPVGEWNEQEVIAKGSRITVILNGTVILDGDIADVNQSIKDRHPGLKCDKGYIGFLRHTSEVRFRNIRIKDLSK